MKRFRIGFHVVVTLALTSVQLSAEPTGFYRPLLKSVLPPDQQDPALAKASIQEQIKSLRELLGTAHFNLSTFFEVDKVASVRPHARFSSSILKSYLLRAADQLWQMDRRDVPLTFDPSDLPAEIDAKIVARRRAIFDQLVLPSLDSIVTDVNLYAAEKEEKPVKTAQEDSLVGALSKYIAETQPSIESKLGKLVWPEVFDGRVTRLHFEKENRIIVLSLGMLSSFRTQHDDAYLVMLEFLVDAVQQKIDSYYKKDSNDQRVLRRLSKAESEKLAAYENAGALLLDRYKGARQSNEVLRKLSSTEIAFLIDLLIQLRGDDWIAGFEVTPLSVLVGEEAEIIRKANDQIALQNKNLPERKKRPLIERSEKLGADINQATNDVVFYADLYQYVFALSDHLSTEKEALNLQNKLMQEVKGEK